jgi:hypothetical protein
MAAALFVASFASQPGAAAAELPRVVLHVTDYQGVSVDELQDAQQRVAAAYRRIGVQLVWTGRPQGVTPRDGDLHVRLTILNAEMTAKHNPDVTALGQGCHAARHAYIYYPRLVGYAIQTQSDPARVLALVVAHELGHVLLPEYSHARTGLMQASTDRRIVSLPPFLPSQASTIREMLTSGR